MKVLLANQNSVYAFLYDNVLSRVFKFYANLSILKKISIYEFIDPNNARINHNNIVSVGLSKKIYL